MGVVGVPPRPRPRPRPLPRPVHDVGLGTKVPYKSWVRQNICLPVKRYLTKYFLESVYMKIKNATATADRKKDNIVYTVDHGRIYP